jgi:hypothetical protein
VGDRWWVRSGWHCVEVWCGVVVVWWWWWWRREW